MQFTQELDNEIKCMEKEIDEVKAFKEFELKVMMKMLHATPKTIPNIILNKKLEDAIDSLIDLPVFGVKELTDYR